ncbi:hypothetical protein H0H93_001883 [Arthromyces matolae]|nr:hypothetical protein H0H93_001883 [Arthromyces matolae]
MNLIRPQILISASLISLALLLASATPIPSLDVVVSRADGNSLITKDSPPLSEVQAPSVTKLFARVSHFDEWMDLNDIVLAFDKGIDGTYGYSATSDQKKDLVRKITELKGLISSSEGVLGHTGIVDLTMSRRIAIIKLWVSTWELDKNKKDAVIGIKSCEAAMVKNHFARDYMPETMLEELDEFVWEFNNKESSIRWKIGRLTALSRFVASLTLEEQSTIRDRLKALFTKLGTMTVRTDLQSKLDHLWELDRLLDVPTE